MFLCFSEILNDLLVSRGFAVRATDSQQIEDKTGSRYIIVYYIFLKFRLKNDCIINKSETIFFNLMEHYIK